MFIGAVSGAHLNPAVSLAFARQMLCTLEDSLPAPYRLPDLVPNTQRRNRQASVAPISDLGILTPTARFCRIPAAPVLHRIPDATKQIVDAGYCTCDQLAS